MRFLISNRFTDVSTKKAIRLISNDVATWIPKSWILELRKESPDDIWGDYWINIPEKTKTSRELILLAYMQFVSREIKTRGDHSKIDYFIGTHRGYETNNGGT